MSRYSNAGEYWQAIGEGKIPDSRVAVPAVGLVDGLDTADGIVDMWDDPNYGNIVDLTENTQIELVSDNAADIGCVFVVFGMKDDGVGNWIEFIEVVISNGTTPVILANPAERVTFCTYQGGNTQLGLISVRPTGSPDDVQLYLSAGQELSRKGFVSLATTATYFPEYFAFGIARETGSLGFNRSGEMYILGRTNKSTWTELFSFKLNTEGTSFATFDVPSFFNTGFPGKKRELKFQCVAETNSSKFWATIFSWEKTK